ncbi:MAG: bifunctional DNA primase/polymerase [Rubrobacter sp.]|nr:bifunctional DNA primase/polymerase [Rubrobacter sp.]
MLDVRGEAGYVILPPSITQRAYEWIDKSPLAGAVWLLKCLSENGRKHCSEGHRSLESRFGAHTLILGEIGHRRFKPGRTRPCHRRGVPTN